MSIRTFLPYLLATSVVFSGCDSKEQKNAYQNPSTPVSSQNLQPTPEQLKQLEEKQKLEQERAKGLRFYETFDKPIELIPVQRYLTKLGQYKFASCCKAEDHGIWKGELVLNDDKKHHCIIGLYVGDWTAGADSYGILEFDFRIEGYDDKEKYWEFSAFPGLMQWDFDGKTPYGVVPLADGIKASNIPGGGFAAEVGKTYHAKLSCLPKTVPQSGRFSKPKTEWETELVVTGVSEAREKREKPWIGDGGSPADSFWFHANNACAAIDNVKFYYPKR